MRTSILSFILCITAIAASGQKVYFVDGYHGGIYGHYPVEWKTRFIVDQLKQNPEWRIGLEIETETWDSVKIRTPEDYEAFKNIVTDKRVEFTNPTYAQPYCYNVSGESIIRQFDYGFRDLNRHFPGLEIVTYAVEEPCFTSSLPQILAQFGFKYAVLKCPNTCWGGYTAPYGGELVNWIGPDGTSLLAVPRYACEELEDNSTWQTKAWANSEEYLAACFDYGIEHPVGMTYQDAGWDNGPWLDSGGRQKNGSVYVTWREYFEEVSTGRTDDDYRMPQEDILPELMWGSQVLQRIARQVRKAENTIVQAEKMGLLAYLANGYRFAESDIDEAWRTLMLAQHHDSWIVPYNRLNKERTWAGEIELWTNNTNEISNSIIEAAGKSFPGSEASDNPSVVYVRVFNTQAVPRTEVARVQVPGRFAGKEITVTGPDGKNVSARITSDGGEHTLAFLASTPSFGYSVYRIEASGKRVKEYEELKLSPKNEYFFENDMYKITFDGSKGGVITSLIAKKEGYKEYVDSSNEFFLGELRGHFYDDGRFHSSAESPAVISATGSHGLETVITIEGRIASHPFTQTVTIGWGQPNIDFDLTIDWQGNPGIGEYKQTEGWAPNRRAFSDGRFKLNVLFPTSLQSPALYKDAPFDVCESRLDNTFFQTWDAIKHNVILNWVDLAEKNNGHGLAVFSDHTTSYVYGEDFPLGLAAQYSGVGLWNRNYEIEGPLHIRFAIVPHSGTWDKACLATLNANWKEPLVAACDANAEMESKSFVDLTGTGYELSAAYPTERGIVIRLYNAEGGDSPREVSFGFPLSEVHQTDLHGNVTGQVPVSGHNKITVSMPRFGLRTYLIANPS